MAISDAEIKEPPELVTPDKRRPREASPETSPVKTAYQGRRVRGKKQLEQPETLTTEQYQRLEALVEDIGLGYQGNPEGTNYSRVPFPFCVLCSAPRHSTPWEYRCTMKCKRKCVGRVCYSCVHGAKLLNLPTRSEFILRKVPDILMVLLAVSRREKLRLQQNGDNKCTCVDCEPED